MSQSSKNKHICSRSARIGKIYNHIVGRKKKCSLPPPPMAFTPSPSGYPPLLRKKISAPFSYENRIKDVIVVSYCKSGSPFLWKRGHKYILESDMLKETEI